ncbi:MAG: hypothetical protein FWD58_00875 [Firmicutes bacterium]|nr:hypothetical protein [Bacillota bacterium]
MGLKPVAFSKMPKYPAQHEVELDKTLLENRPKAWLAKPIVGLALSAIMAAGLVGCIPASERAGRTGNGDGATKTEQSTDNDNNNGNTDGTGNNNGSNGNTGNNDNWEDWGVTGGIPMLSYVHLADRDALTIIADELSKSGFSFVQNLAEQSDKNSSFAFDGYFLNGENKIDLEYVSKEDAENQKYPGLAYQGEGYFEFYDARSVSMELKKAYPDAAVFFDPVTDWQPTSEELLRAQVLDFIEWLMSVGE